MDNPLYILEANPVNFNALVLDNEYEAIKNYRSMMTEALQ